MSSVCGQGHTLIDYPAPSGAVSLAEERAQDRRPCWVEVDPTNIYGWRLDRESNYGNLVQIRIAEKVNNFFLQKTRAVWCHVRTDWTGDRIRSNRNRCNIMTELSEVVVFLLQLGTF